MLKDNNYQQYFYSYLINVLLNLRLTPQKLRLLTVPSRSWGPALVKHRRLVNYVNGFVVDPFTEKGELNRAYSGSSINTLNSNHVSNNYGTRVRSSNGVRVSINHFLLDLRRCNIQIRIILFLEKCLKKQEFHRINDLVVLATSLAFWWPSCPLLSQKYIN